MNIITPILTLAILAGQLIKLPVGLGGVSILDVTIFFLDVYLIAKLKLNFNRPPQFIIISLIFILIAIISLILTPLHLELSEYLISFLYIVRFSLYILFGYLIYSTKLNINLTYSGIGLAILGLLQFLFFPDLSFLTQWGWDPHYFRTASTFLDPNFAGAFFVLTLISQNLATTKRKNIFLFILIFLALLTTFSRSSYLMFFVSFLTLSFLQKSKKLMIKTILLFIILLLGFQIYTRLVSQPRNIDREQSASFRLNAWQQGGRLFQDHPFLGVGFNAYQFALKEYKLGDEKFLKSHGASSNDSSLLFVAATTGLLGLICYLLFLGSLLRVGIKENFILAASILGLLSHSLFANSLFFPPILLWLLLQAFVKTH